MQRIRPVIMCGGAGSRLWPRSRAAHPKQFLDLIDERTLLEATAARLAAAGAAMEILSPIVICGAGQDALVEAQLARAGKPAHRIIVEPFGRNTGAVAAVASLVSHTDDPDALVLLLPADHHIADDAGFWRGVEAGLVAASDGALVTLGIEPTGPETGYGYIRRGDAIGTGVYRVDQFKEKPDSETARGYLATGLYSWNAGIFLFRADAMLNAFKSHAPGILAACDRAVRDAASVKTRLHLSPAAFESCPSEPVDIAIMEKAERVAVVAPVRAGWNDVGSWTAIADLKKAGIAADSKNPNVQTIDCDNCLIESEGPFVAAIGLKDIIIVATPDGILVTHRDHTQDVKKIVDHLKASRRTDLL
jgi:mannose-1-phosphate guanylyltransferase/mannose-6-phosphate isomerase